MAVRATDFQVPKITHEEITEHRGVFVIEPLDRGFGYTFGNSLRRVLLSSLEGAAVTSVKIEGVAHEFTTLPGVREDVTDIILNLKQLVCILHGESPEVEVRLTKRGDGVVTAADIEAPADLEILNPDLEIANLSSKGRLEITLTIGRGRGYVPAEGNRGQAHTIGVIPVDSMFSPINRVSYDVEAARVGQRTDYDKLILDVTTDGSIDPKDAIAEAAEILIRQLAIFTDLDRIEPYGDAAAGGDGGGDAAPSLAGGMENFPIEELELGVRSYNCLKRVGIETIGDLVAKSESELAAIPNFGKKSIEEVKETLAAARSHPAGRQHERARGVGRRRAPPADRQEARSRRSAPQGALLEPRGRADRARPHQDDRDEGQGGEADRRADDHARPPRRPPRAPAGDVVPALADVVHKLFADVAPRFRTAPAATRGSSRSARARATPPRWRTSSWSTRSTWRPSARARDRRRGAGARRSRRPRRGARPSAEADGGGGRGRGSGAEREDARARAEDEPPAEDEERRAEPGTKP